MSADTAPRGQEERKQRPVVGAGDVARLHHLTLLLFSLLEHFILDPTPETWKDLDLTLAYHCCDFSTEVSKQVLDLNLTLRTLFSDIFSERLVDTRVKQAISTVLTTILPTRSKEGYACFYAYILDRDAKNFVFVDAVRAGFMVIDLWQEEEGPCPGLILVYDLEAMSLGHLTKLDIQTVQQLLYFLQEAMLIRVKGMHFINAPPFMNRLLALIKPFMKKELIDMLIVHESGSRTLDKYYPIDALPPVTEARLQIKENIIKKLEMNTSFFLEENKKRVTECKRPGKPKTVADFFGGVEGSFKKLDID